jgi:hypothetical protein
LGASAEKLSTFIHPTVLLKTVIKKWIMLVEIWKGADMQTKTLSPVLFLIGIILISGLACSLPGFATASPPQVQPVQPVAPPPIATPVSGEPNPPPLPTPTDTQVVTHVSFPSSSPNPGTIVYDVESAGTAPEKRAPYGDSYDIYRMERPFTQDMTYIPDMDISTYNVRIDEEWIYVSIKLFGTDPNNEMGIHFGVELDLDADGFGEYIIWSNPPYTSEWSTDGVQVFEDENHDTGGVSAERSDAPLDGNGYEKLIFDAGIGDDPDLAWIRINAGGQATVQFSFKQSLAGPTFMLGVLSDAGLKDVGRMYYNDRFTEEQAGSPEKREQYYPLKELYAFDNACREAFGFSPTGYEPQLCPREEPTPKPKDTPEPEVTRETCSPPQSTTVYCAWDPVECRCTNLP